MGFVANNKTGVTDTMLDKLAAEYESGDLLVRQEGRITTGRPISAARNWSMSRSGCQNQRLRPSQQGGGRQSLGEHRLVSKPLI
jgi:hypothetical protein